MAYARIGAALLVWCVFAPAQAPPTQAAADKSPEIASRDAPSTFSSKVNLVMVPVVVRDPRGHAIGTLKKEDFQLFDKGKPQVISRFAIETADGRLKPMQVTGEPDLEEKKPTDDLLLANRFVAYVFDDMHTNFADLAQARAAAVKHLAETLKGADRAAVYTTSGQTALDFTDDRDKLQETMNRILPRSRLSGGLSQCPDITPYMADLIQNKNDTIALAAAGREAVACGAATTAAIGQSIAQGVASQVLGVAEADVQVTLSTLKATVQRMAAMPGQRTVVLVSSGFIVTINYRQQEVELIDRAIRANVTISTLDARGLYVIVPGGDASQSSTSIVASNNRARYQTEAALAEGDVLGELADGTGGTFFHNNNDLLEGFRQTGATPEFMYILGFSPQNLKFDGTYHSLKVTAKETKGVSLQARRGYYAPKHANDPAEDAKEEIRVALFSREELSDIPVELHTQFFKSTDTNAKLAVLAHVDLKHLHFKKVDGRSRNVLSIVSAVFDRNGVLVGAIQKDVEMRLKDETFNARIANGVTMKTSFDVAPGSYVVRLVVRDSEGQTMAAHNGVVEIP
ncbi:MAG TPA: VWA domain-containing protein [Bryobacteraceae bacterium]|jgi:VWFA-related protein|nr:VWA domain-containing protein [Bryobacteraceae bacterium]